MTDTWTQGIGGKEYAEFLGTLFDKVTRTVEVLDESTGRLVEVYYVWKDEVDVEYDTTLFGEERGEELGQDADDENIESVEPVITGTIFNAGRRLNAEGKETTGTDENTSLAKDRERTREQNADRAKQSRSKTKRAYRKNSQAKVKHGQERRIMAKRVQAAVRGKQARSKQKRRLDAAKVIVNESRCALARRRTATELSNSPPSQGVDQPQKVDGSECGTRGGVSALHDQGGMVQLHMLTSAQSRKGRTIWFRGLSGTSSSVHVCREKRPDIVFIEALDSPVQKTRETGFQRAKASMYNKHPCLNYAHWQHCPYEHRAQPKFLASALLSSPSIPVPHTGWLRSPHPPQSAGFIAQVAPTGEEKMVMSMSQPASQWSYTSWQTTPRKILTQGMSTETLVRNSKVSPNGPLAAAHRPRSASQVDTLFRAGSLAPAGVASAPRLTTPLRVAKRSCISGSVLTRTSLQRPLSSTTRAFQRHESRRSALTHFGG